MIRIIMVALTVVLFLIFSVPLLGILGARDKKDPEGAQIKSLHIVQGVFRFILRLAGVTYEVQGLENIPADRAVLYPCGICDRTRTDRVCCQKGDA